MRTIKYVCFTLTCYFLAQTVHAADQTTEQVLEDLQQRLEYAEQHLRAQDRAILDQGEANPITMTGVIEVDAVSNDDESEISVSTVELGFGADIANAAVGEVVLLYEGEDIEVDTAIIGISSRETDLEFVLGKYVVPFGVFNTHMLSDPLTLEIAETNTNAIQAGYTPGPLKFSVYAFNDVNEDDESEISNFGAQFTYSNENAGLELVIGYIDDLTQADGLENYADEDLPAFALSAQYETGPYTFIAELIKATDDLSDDTSPSAINLEAVMGHLWNGKHTTFAIGYQTTDDAETLELPERRALAAVVIGIMENTRLGFEFAADSDYDDADTSTLTARISVDF